MKYEKKAWKKSRRDHLYSVDTSKRFNEYEYDKICRLKRRDPELALEMIENYLANYQEDYKAYLIHAEILISMGEFAKAAAVNTKCVDMFLSNKRFIINSTREKILKLNNHVVKNKIRLAALNGDYNEAFRLFKTEFNAYLEKEEYGAYYVYFKRILGLIDYDRERYSSYLYRQMVEYKLEDFFDHIEKHLLDESLSEEEPASTAVFMPDFPIETIVEEAKKYIPSENRFYNSLAENIYVFKYDLCGTSDGIISDYFMIITMHNTQEFITMYPIKNRYNLPYVDLNYLKKDNLSQEELTRRKARVTAFKNRLLTNKKES